MELVLPQKSVLVSSSVLQIGYDVHQVYVFYEELRHCILLRCSSVLCFFRLDDQSVRDGVEATQQRTTSVVCLKHLYEEGQKLQHGNYDFFFCHEGLRIWLT